MGITTGAEAEAYEQAKAARAGFRPLPARDRAAESVPSGARVNAGQHRFLHGTPPPGHNPQKEVPRAPGHGGRKPPTPLNLANAASLDLLSSEEQSLCSTLRVLPKPYLTIKEMYIRENERRKGLLKRRDARKMMKIDVNKSGRIFDFLVSSGMLILAYDPSAKPVFPPPRETSGVFAPTVNLTNGMNGMNGMNGVSMNGMNGMGGMNGMSMGGMGMNGVNGVNGYDGVHSFHGPMSLGKSLEA